MTRAQRKFHRRLWPALALLVGVGFALALIWRPPPDPPEPVQAAQESTR